VTTADGDVALVVSGLRPDSVYQWTATATSAAGTASTPAFARSTSFHTLPLSKVSPPAISAPRAVYGSWVTVSGTLPGAPALPVALAQEPFPYAFPFVAVPGATGGTDADGSYRFTVQALATTRYGLLAPGYEGPTAGNSVQLTIFPAVTVRVRRLRGHRFVVSGSYRPDAVADATLYRLGRGRAGDFVTPASAGDGSRTFRFPARALAPGAYEVRIKTARHKGVASTHSAPFTIPRR
jgi:hypothetical protein